MNRERAKELLPIITAFAEGKELQIRQYDDSWYTVTKDDDINFTSGISSYRIKPSRRKVWVVFSPFWSYAYDDECIARGVADQNFGKVVCVEEPE